MKYKVTELITLLDTRIKKPIYRCNSLWNVIDKDNNKFSAILYPFYTNGFIFEQNSDSFHRIIRMFGNFQKFSVYPKIYDFYICDGNKETWNYDGRKYLKDLEYGVIITEQLSGTLFNYIEEYEGYILRSDKIRAINQLVYKHTELVSNKYAFNDYPNSTNFLYTETNNGIKWFFGITPLALPMSEFNSDTMLKKSITQSYNIINNLFRLYVSLLDFLRIKFNGLYKIGMFGSIWDKDPKTVTKVVMFLNNKDMGQFLREVEMIKLFSPLKVCPKLYTTHLNFITKQDMINSTKPVHCYIKHKYGLYSYVPDNTIIYGEIDMKKCNGDLNDYAAYCKKQEIEPNIDRIVNSLWKKHDIMIAHNYLYTDIHAGNFLYTEREGHKTKWYFADMDMQTFDEFEKKYGKRKLNYHIENLKYKIQKCIEKVFKK